MREGRAHSLCSSRAKTRRSSSSLCEHARPIQLRFLGRAISPTARGTRGQGSSRASGSSSARSDRTIGSRSPLPTSAPGLGPPRPHCTGTGPTPPASVPRSGPTPAHICTGTRLAPPTSAPRLALPRSHLPPGLAGWKLPDLSAERLLAGLLRDALHRAHHAVSTPRVPLEYPSSTPGVPLEYPSSTPRVPLEYPT